MPTQKVTLVGATGRLGRAILSALVAAPESFTVTVLSRHSSASKSTSPPNTHSNVNHVSISDSFPADELERVLAGQDALVVAAAGADSALQIRLASAAAKAGVRRFVPADFGSCDSSSERAVELLPLYRAKRDVRGWLQGLAAGADGADKGAGTESSPGRGSQSMTWTSLVCGHFFDYGLRSGLLQFDLGRRHARIFDGGDVRWSTTTLTTVAAAVVAVLDRRREDETRNRMLYIQSFCVSQNEVLAALERATSTSTSTSTPGQGQDQQGKWQVEHVDSEEFIRQVKTKVDADPGDAEARESLVSVLGIVDANWEGKGADFANALLGLEGEDLDEVVRKVVNG